ncbi:MAG: signal peptide peptidase SppA [Sphingobacteriaceae bacterium]|nr:MAG: signal peptide peptidase SppA [Sphingobacteriaceae bacterium]
MKQFFKFVLATVVGIILTSVIMMILTFAIIGGIISSAEKTVVVDANSILTIQFKQPITERTPNDPLAELGLFGLGKNKVIGLDDILANIKKAKTDDNIKGIFLNQSYLESGQATTEEIRNALIDFKKSKKFIVAYAEVYTQSFYYLASVADKVYLNPNGYFDLSGFNSEVTFFKGTLDKLGIEAQVIKVGTYKSAVEPFILTEMSAANKLQVSSYLNSMYNHFLAGISKTRGVNRDSLYSYADKLKIQYPQDALKYKLVDGLKYKDEVLNDLKKRTETDLDDDLNSVSITDYIHSSGKNATDDNDEVEGSSSERIAIIYANGEIISGEGDNETIGSEKISKALRKVRLDKKVKAVVLRVNSPGGSSLASDVIWREVALTKKAKPVIVSMGDVAASGGYYISAAADSIFAQPNTITGSIGIFAVLPNMQKFFNDKLGLTFDNVKTGSYADLGDASRPLTPAERGILQNQVNRGYSIFTKVVADGRKKTQAYVDSIGQGRVWTGEQALKIGLVDRLGNIDDAVKSAAKMAKLKSYKLVSYPEQESMWGELGSGMSAKIKESMLKSELGDKYTYYQQVKSLESIMRVPQARLPFNVVIK